MRRPLKLHPDSRCSAATHIEVQITRQRKSNLALHYFVTGKTDNLLLPPAIPLARGDELWQHTCFEAFIGTTSGGPYNEFNFAPSMEWAAYEFSDYRKGMSPLNEIDAPQMDAQLDDEGYQLQVSLNLDRLTNLPAGADWRLGVSAIIEETGGDKSYWALAHSPGKADFHRADCFIHNLKKSER